MRQRTAAGRVVVGKDVATVRVVQAHVQVRAAAGLVAIGLGQEGRFHAVVPRHALDQALEADGLVAGQQHVVDVVQVDLELAGTVFGEHRARRKLLRPGCGIDRGQHRGVLVQFRHRVDLRPVFPPSGKRLPGRLGTAFRRALAVHEIELEFDGHDRTKPQAAEARGDPRQHVTRVAVERSAVVLVHRDLRLRDVAAEPGHGRKRAGHRQAGAVGIALVEAEAGGLHGSAEYVQREHRPGKQQTVTVNAFEFVHRHALAARDAHLVGQQQVDGTHLRVVRKPGTRLLVIRELRHVTPVV